MDFEKELQLILTRRQLFSRTSVGIGTAALASLLPERSHRRHNHDRSQNRRTGRAAALCAQSQTSHLSASVGRPVAGRALRLQAQPQEIAWHRASRFHPSWPAHHRHDFRAGFLPCGGAHLQFKQHGKSGTWLSELLPHTAKIVDDIAIIKTMNTEAINHDPAITFIQSGSQQPGRPSMGSWVSYGLGSENQNLPAYVVLLSQANALNIDQPLFSRLWGSGFLPSRYQGVRFRSSGDPVLYLADAPGIDRTTRRNMLDVVARSIACARKPMAIQKSRRASRSTKWPIVCRPRCRRSWISGRT